MAKVNFEQLLEYVVNGETAKAEELFHQLIVQKSREIYENIIEDEMKDVDIDEASEEDDEEEMDEAREEDEEELDEASEEDDEEMDEAREEDDEEMDENFGFEAMGGDETDDLVGDIGDEGDSDDDGMDSDEEDHDEGDEESRISDLEDALADLKAEFERLMADEKKEPEHADIFGGDEEGGEEGNEDESMMPAFEEEIEEIDLSPAEQMREYVEKVSAGHGAEKKGSGEASGTNSKSSVAKKNDMGGTTANIARGGEGSDKGTKGGLLDPSTKPQDGGNVNVPGSKNATKLSAVSKGHGAEKKGAGEVGGTEKKSLFK